jgi:cob(I)alamin adenosyltransferase
MEKAEKKGLVIVYTGNGKGKTTAALGICLRASGHGLKSVIVQFIKGSWKYGELDGIKKLSPNVEIFQKGLGYVGIRGDKYDKSEHIKVANEALEFTRELMLSGRYDILILDELNLAVSLGLIDIKDILKFIEQKPKKMDIIFTGRNADEKLIDNADLVTEMKEIKHPFQKGITARKGIDY